MKKILVLFLILLLSTGCFAVIEKDSLQVFAVTDQGNAMASKLILTIKPGNGMIWTDIEPLVGTSTQSTAKIAVETAHDYSNEVEKYDYFFNIESDASLVEGPSAGAAMTLLVISMLQNKEIPDEVALTGTITAEGGVGSVGGIFEKSKEAAKVGITLFMIPTGDSRQTVKEDGKVKSINLIDYAYKNWGIKIIEVNNINDVLFYAFAKIDSIDINTGGIPRIDFIPEKINLSENLAPMKTLTEKYLSDAEDSVRSAKTALSGTMLNDPALVDVMLSYLNESEKTLEKGKILYEQNFLYSAANFSFLATINSNFVKDISENPSLLSRNSTAFNDKVKKLSGEIDSLAYDLNRFIPIEGFEWHIAAKERLSWAKLKLDTLELSDDIVIIVEQDGLDLERVSNIMDYEYALAWYSVSKDFFELTKGATSGVLSDLGLNNLIDSYITNAENGLEALGDVEAEDIERRLDSAKILRKEGWFYASLFDSSSALALVNSEIFSKDKDLDQLQFVLLERLVALDQKINNNENEFVWARLYLDHAKYYFDSSEFYTLQEQPALALESVKSGLDLVFLAEGVFDAAIASYDHLNQLSQNSFIEISPGWQDKPELEDSLYALVLVVILVIALIIFSFVASEKKFHFLKKFSFEDRLDDILKQQRKLRQRLEKGYIKKEQFEILNKPIQNKLNVLLAERKAISANYVDLDLNKSKIDAFENVLRDLRIQLRKRKITAEDYASNIAFYTKRVELLKQIVKEDEKKIKSGKKNAEANFSKEKIKAKDETKKAKDEDKRETKKPKKEIIS